MKFYKLDIAISILSLTLFLGSLVYAFQSLEIVKENLKLATASVSGRGIEGLEIRERGHDFGLRRMSGGEIKYFVPIKNTSRERIFISRVYSFCDCLTPDFSEKIISPGEVINLGVTINLAGYGPFGVGIISPVLFIEDKNGAAEKLTFSVLAIP